MNKKKIISGVLLIVFIVIMLLIIHTLRNFIIVKRLQENIKPYLESKNYHIKTKTIDDKGMEVILNYYHKDEKELAILENNSNGNNSKMSMYNNGQRIDVFYDTPTEKKVQIDSKGSMLVNTCNYLETENDWQTLIACIPAIIKNVEYNEKKCYSINNFMSSLFLIGNEKNEIYFDKDTGLYLKAMMDEQISEREYEFDKVTDEIFVEPDISKYELQENS
ncbi:MAG: hypothetical protein HFJ17_01205 [Clostridia bacterium]|nr:hypothetical protein [Clostridia bacterium]